jgi:hypothetical protein
VKPRLVVAGRKRIEDPTCLLFGRTVAGVTHDAARHRCLGAQVSDAQPAELVSESLLTARHRTQASGDLEESSVVALNGFHDAATHDLDDPPGVPGPYAGDRTGGGTRDGCIPMEGPGDTW